MNDPLNNLPGPGSETSTGALRGAVTGVGFRILVLLSLLLPLQAFGQTDYEQLFWGQIFSSCHEGATWQKSVYDLKGDSPETPQTKKYKIRCGSGEFVSLENDNTSSPGTHEFDFLFEYLATNRYIKEYFEISEDGKGLVATIKADNADDTPLQQQVFSMDGAGRLVYVKSVIQKDNLLYSMKVTIKVFFDESGRYDRHQIETETDPIAQDGIHTRIEAAHIWQQKLWEDIDQLFQTNAIQEPIHV